MPAFNEAMVGVQFQRIGERLRAIEAQLAVLSEKAGVDYREPAKDVPPEVLELVEAGKELEALKRYRELTGAPMAEAQEVIAGI
jgi:ribosomal protein L7/L12